MDLDVRITAQHQLELMDNCKHICDKVKAALQVFTPEERSCLTAIFQTGVDIFEQGTFIGIRYWDKSIKKDIKFINPEKAAAILILEEQYKWELRNNHIRYTEWAMQEVKRRLGDD